MFQNKKALQLIISAIATFIIWQLYLKAKEQNIELGYGMVDVLSASSDIPRHRALSDDLITIMHVPSRFVEPGAIREKIPGVARKKIIGKVSAVPIPAGTQITATLLRDPSAKETGVAPMLPPGKRGYVMRLGNLEVAKLILPGDRIDILATFSVRNKGMDAPSRATYTILQNILVVAVDKDIIESSRDGKKETTEGRVLTLALDPLDSQKLAHAQIESGGEISVVVRAQGDTETIQIPASNSANLLDQAQPARVPTPTKKPSRK
jgi:Flp pilus assembly protein CpaB